MIRTLCFLALLASIAASQNAFASGWNDYQLDIGDGFRIVRCNSLDVCLADSTGSVLYAPDSFESTGPINGYYITPTAILLRTYGRAPRNHFPGDTFENVDTSRQFYLAYDRLSKKLSRPTNTPSDLNALHGTLHWTAPSNPNPTSLVGLTALLFAMFVFIGGPIALGLGLVYLLYQATKTKAPNLNG
jgi:hypothetical protein